MRPACFRICTGRHLQDGNPWSFSTLFLLRQSGRFAELDGPSSRTSGHLERAGAIRWLGPASSTTNANCPHGRPETGARRKVECEPRGWPSAEERVRLSTGAPLASGLAWRAETRTRHYPRVLIRGLARISRNNRNPIEFNAVVEWFSTHPSTYKRIRVLANAAGLDGAGTRCATARPCGLLASSAGLSVAWLLDEIHGSRDRLAVGGVVVGVHDYQGSRRNGDVRQ
jgi:hypothetical protein